MKNPKRRCSRGPKSSCKNNRNYCSFHSYGNKIPRIKTSYSGKALACSLRGLPGIPNLNGTTLKRRRQPLGFIHNSHSGNQMRLWSLCAGGGPERCERRRLDEHSTEQGPYDASSRKQEPTATRRCGTDGGGLRHRQEKEDASSQSTMSSITTHLAGLSPPKKIALPAPSLTPW